MIQHESAGEAGEKFQKISQIDFTLSHSANFQEYYSNVYIAREKERLPVDEKILQFMKIGITIGAARNI